MTVPTSTESRVRTLDGIELLVRAWPPVDPLAHVLIVHGLGEHSGRYEHVAGWLAAAGFAVLPTG